MVVGGKKVQASRQPGRSSSSSSSAVVVQQAEVAAAGKGGMRKGPWTEQEDVQLVWFVRLLGERRWDFLAKVSGLQRSGKSCRLRWVNYLHPGLKRGRMSPEEERMVVQLHAKHGNRWSRIAKSMPGRTDNEIKNYWRTHLRKQAAQKQQLNLQAASTPSSSSISDDDHNSSSSSSSSNGSSSNNNNNDDSMQQQQQLSSFHLPLWNDDNIDCWSSTQLVAPASPLWDIDDAFCSDYSLPLPLWGSAHDDADYIN
uniref:Uncharacterized protein n=1 Tax=Leersia perrieri TaxID=77586 RepID=A0A0D9VAY2_9ORYZ